MTKELTTALGICTLPVRETILGLGQAEKIEEVHFARGRCITVYTRGHRRELPNLPVTGQMLEDMVSAATGHAAYAVQSQLRQGFLPLRGGHRLGLCGQGIYQAGGLHTLRAISSCNLRIARQIYGCADAAVDYLWTHPRSTLILGPPGRGKTTLLRDLIRQLSQRFFWRICVADERMELAGTFDGVPQFDLGPTTDVLSGVQKSDAIPMLLRAMGPQWIAVDEITAPEDVERIVQASYCGVQLIATAHAATMEELARRPVYRLLLEAGVFENFLRLRPDRHIQMEGRP